MKTLILIMCCMALSGCKIAGVDIYDPNSGKRIAHGSIAKFGLDTETKGFKGEVSKDKIKISFDNQSDQTVPVTINVTPTGVSGNMGKAE